MKLAILTLAVSAVFATQAIAGTINFDSLSLGNFDDIPANHGDHGSGGEGDVRVGVKYIGDIGCAQTNHLDFWNANYGNLNKVAYTPTDGCTARIEFQADPGWLISSLSFDLAGFPNADLTAKQVSVGLGGAGFDLLNYPILGATAPFASNFGFLVASGGSNAFIQWGTDWNIGIDNIVFQVVPAAVPEPGTLALVALMLAGMACARKSRKPKPLHRAASNRAR